MPADAVLIDVREPGEFADFYIPGAVKVPLVEITVGGAVPAEITGAGERPVVVYCAGGVRSATAVQALQDAGVTGPLSLAGGIGARLDRQS